MKKKSDIYTVYMMCGGKKHIKIKPIRVGKEWSERIVREYAYRGGQ